MNLYNSPFKELETLVAEEAIKLRVKEFISSFIDENDTAYGIAHIDTDKGIVYTEEGDFYSFEHYYRCNISHAVGIAKEKINLLLLNDLQNLHSHRDNLELELRYLLEHGTVKKFSTFKINIFEVVDYFNAKFGATNDATIKLERGETAPITNLSTAEEKFEAILGYLRGLNHIGKQILQSGDYNSLKESFLQLIDKSNDIPAPPKVSVNKSISKNLLLFSFWVLHKYIYGTKEISEDYLLLLHGSFTEFDTWSFNTIKKKFGSKEGISFKGVTHLPQIITTELERK